MNKKYLRNRLCIPVRGFNRSIIYDIVRRDYYFISNEEFNVLNTSDILNFNKIVNLKKRKEVKKYLIREEIIFEISNSKEKELFPELDTSTNNPFLINDILLHDNIHLNSLIKLKSIDIRNISVLVNNFNKRGLFKLLKELSQLEVESIYMFLVEENSTYCNDDFLEFKHIPQLFNIYLFNSTFERIQSRKPDIINVIQLPYSFEDYCKELYPEKLNINFEHFLEGLNFHTYYNKKLYVDKRGYIKNGLNNEVSHANFDVISQKELLELLNSVEFQKFSNINKNDTLICDVCEFKYMCVDSRVPIQTKNEVWYHDIECTYNPYISKWKNEPGYLNLKEAGVEIDKISGKVIIDQGMLQTSFEIAWKSIG